MVHSGLTAVWHGPFWSSDCWIWFHFCLRNSVGIYTGPFSRFARALKRVSQTNPPYALVNKSCPICSRKDDAKQTQFLHHDGFQYMYIVTFPSSLVYSFLVYFFCFDRPYWFRSYLHSIPDGTYLFLCFLIVSYCVHTVAVNALCLIRGGRCRGRMVL